MFNREATKASERTIFSYPKKVINFMILPEKKFFFSFFSHYGLKYLIYFEGLTVILENFWYVT